jgi:cobalt/nickel transport system permease protein
MRFEPLSTRADRDRNGPLQRLDGRLKLISALVYIVAVVATPVGWWKTMGALGLALAFLVGLSGASPARLFARWLGFLVLVGFLAVMMAPGIQSRGEHGLVAVVASILARNSLAFVMMLVLSETTSWTELLVSMRRLGIPRSFVAVLQLMERYLHVIGDELRRMATARRARSFRRRGGMSWGLLSGMIGMLLLRSVERAERVHSAMLARGWDGQLRTLDD